MQRAKKTLQTLSKYRAIGFDSDFCLVRYKLDEFFSRLYNLTAKVLVEEKSYPKHMLDFGKREKCFIMNGLVFDYKTGYIFKLGENKIITRAHYGFDRVSHEELKAKFGDPPRYDAFNPYVCHGESYLCCVSFLECFFPALLTHMVEHKKSQGNKGQINTKELLHDAMYATKKVTKEYVMQSVMKRDFEKLLYKQNKLKSILQKLREKGKVLFIVSNAHSAYNAAVMSYAFGDDWKSLFDFIITDAGKPEFFLKKDTPFYEINPTTFEKSSKEVTELRKHQSYIGGNAKLLEENIAKISQEDSGRVLYFGDNYSTDALAAEKIDHWDSVCIIEEMGDVDFGEEYDDSVWGHWKYEETPYGKIPAFWHSYMSKNVAMCTSLVDSIEMMSFYELE